VGRLQKAKALRVGEIEVGSSVYVGNIDFDSVTLAQSATRGKEGPCTFKVHGGCC
jgi:hypothetical protein